MTQLRRAASTLARPPDDAMGDDAYPMFRALADKMRRRRGAVR